MTSYKQPWALGLCHANRVSEQAPLCPSTSTGASLRRNPSLIATVTLTIWPSRAGKNNYTSFLSLSHVPFIFHPCQFNDGILNAFFTKCPTELISAAFTEIDFKQPDGGERQT